MHTYLHSLLEAAAAGEPFAGDPARLAAALEAQRDSEREQAETLARVRSLFDCAPVGIARVDSLGRCLEVNATGQEMLGYSADELRGLTFGDLIHPAHLQDQLDLHQELIAGKRSSYEVEQRFIRRDGRELWAHTRSMLASAGAGEEPTAIAVVQDISEQKLAERALHDSRERLARIAETQRDIAAAGTDLTSVMELIAERSMALTGADGSMVNLIEGDELFIGAAAGVAGFLMGRRRPIEGTVVQHALAAGGTILIEDTLTDPRINQDLQAKIGDLSLICVPLFQGDRAVAAINVLSTSEDERLNEQDRQMLELLAVVLAAAISRAAEFEAKREQLEALARFEATFEGALTGMVLTDLDGQISEANPAMEEMLGYGDGELAGRWISEFLHADDRERARTSYLDVFAQAADSGGLGHRFVRRDGELLWANASVAVLDSADGQKAFAIAMVQDVTHRKKAEDALRAQSDLNEYQALHDPLTGLANRRLFRDRIDRALALARRTDSEAAVLVLDVDGFKEVNDSLDHAAGDALLVELGKRLEGVLRKADTVARMGGDEFGLLLPNPGTPADVLRAIGRVRAAIEEPVTVQGLPLVVEASIGIALYPEDGGDVDTLLQRADVAMYHAKEANADWAFARDSEARSDPSRLSLVGELRRALDHDELTLYYQPKALLADGEVNAVEALVRWNHPIRGLVLPAEFIPIAQQTGIIKPLTTFVLNEALRQCREWQNEGLRLSVSVNLCTRNLVDVDFPTHVQALLERWNVDPSLLALEITEATILADPDRTRQILERLSEMGVRISVDDFGTGHSSLAYLKRLPIAEIKIDRSLIMNMEENQDDATIVRSTIDLGRNLGLEVVAAGVETEAAWNHLDALGCTIAQGYYLGRPMPAEDLHAWFDSHESRAKLVAKQA